MAIPPISDFEVFKQYFTDQIDNLTIPQDISTAYIKYITSELDRIFNEIQYAHTKCKIIYENTEDAIDEVKIRNYKGGNEADRKRNGYEAVANYVDRNGNVVNLFEFLREYREKYYFTKSILDALNFKRQLIISDNSALKIEAGLADGGL